MKIARGIAMLLLLSATAGAVHAQDAPPFWRPGMPRVNGLPVLWLDSTVYRGWLPRDSIRSLVGGFTGLAPWRTCSDAGGNLGGSDGFTVQVVSPQPATCAAAPAPWAAVMAASSDGAGRATAAADVADEI